MATYQVIPTPSTAEGFLKRIKGALAADATSVEVFANDDGALKLVVWLDKRTVWKQHDDVG
jgi:hypothetical protein